mgnify:CR=1 FL=1|jgi:hypothetical protein
MVRLSILSDSFKILRRRADPYGIEAHPGDVIELGDDGSPCSPAIASVVRIARGVACRGGETVGEKSVCSAT